MLFVCYFWHNKMSMKYIWLLKFQCVFKLGVIYPDLLTPGASQPL